jgi:hypothetical protein
LASTLIDDTPVSAFSVLADKFSIVNPDSTADNPIIPFTVSANKINMATDVAISGDLITSGTVSAARLDVSGLITAGSLVVTSAVNDNVTAISGDVIATGTVSTDRLDVSSLITAGSLVVTSAVNDNVTAISGDVIATGTVSADRIDVSGLITAGNLVITSTVNDNVTAISGGVITTGTINADRINIDGVTLDTDGSNQLIIKDNGVSTPKIIDNAATLPESAMTVAETILSNSTDNEVQSLTHVATGATIEIFVSLSLRWVNVPNTSFTASTIRPTEVALFAGTTELFTTTVQVAYVSGLNLTAGRGVVVGFAVSQTPSAGSVDYKVKVNPGSQPSNTGQVRASNKYLRTLELKK